ncbi:MAG: hypothetical protein N3A69_16375, partial [Leptospiraceae bacterium]|nr:hypothetical protein [Leptospiraceae bacterium]
MISLKCPYCFKDFSIQNKLSQITCPYCRRVMIVSYSHQSTNDNESIIEKASDIAKENPLLVGLGLGALGV